MPSAELVPNELFRRARERLFGTREALADAVNCLVPVAFAVSANDIGKIERGKVTWPRGPRRAGYREALQAASDEELGFCDSRKKQSALTGHPHDSAQSGSAARVAQPSEASVNASASTGPAPWQLGYELRQRDHQRAFIQPSPLLSSTGALHGALAPAPRAAQTYVPFRPAALDRPALDWLCGDQPQSHICNTSLPPIQQTEVNTAVRQLGALRELDHGYGAGAVAPLVVRFLDDTVRELLSRPSADPMMVTKVYQVAIGARELAGYQAVDSGADGMAQRHYLHALSLTIRTGQRAFGAYLLGVSLGHLALHCGHPERGLRMGQIAIKGLPPVVTPGLHAALWAVVARSYARLGDESSCTTALLAAETHLAHRDPVTEPDWITYLTPAYLADEVAHCMFDLAHYDTARAQVQQAVEGVGAGRLRRLAIDTALLASSLAAEGDVDEACSRGRDAVDLAARTGSGRAVQRVAQVRADLIPYEDTVAVREFVEYVHAVLPAAA
jgi:hypothetical protein